MLCKVSEDTVIGLLPLTTGITETATFSAGDNNSWTGGTYDTYTFTNSSSNSIELSLRWKGSIRASSNVWAHLSYEIDGTDTIIWEVGDHGTANYSLDETENNIILGANKTLKIKYRGRYSWANISVTRQLIEITYKGESPITKQSELTHPSLPRELETLGNKAKATLFGMHIDNTRYTGETN